MLACLLLLAATREEPARTGADLDARVRVVLEELVVDLGRLVILLRQLVGARELDLELEALRRELDRATQPRDRLLGLVELGQRLRDLEVTFRIVGARLDELAQPRLGLRGVTRAQVRRAERQRDRRILLGLGLERLEQLRCLAA